MMGPMRAAARRALLQAVRWVLLQGAHMRAMVALVGLVTLVTTAGACMIGHTKASAMQAPAPSPTPAAETRDEALATPPHEPKELPRGGRTLFPDYRLVGFCGTPGAPALGALQGNLSAVTKTLEAQAAHYANGANGAN